MYDSLYFLHHKFVHVLDLHFFTSLIIGVICMILAIFQSDDSGGTIGGGGLPWKL